MMPELGTRTPPESDLIPSESFKFLNSEDLAQPHPKFWAEGLWQGLRSLHCQIVNTED
jgi:hypothetical protein